MYVELETIVVNFFCQPLQIKSKVYSHMWLNILGCFIAQSKGMSVYHNVTTGILRELTSTLQFSHK